MPSLSHAQVRVDDVPRPTILAPTDAVVRITAASLDSGNVHRFAAGGAIYRGMVLGHSGVGYVCEAGAGCAVPVGTRVAISAVIACGHCRFCARGEPAFCNVTGPPRPVEEGGGTVRAAILGWDAGG